MSQLKSSNATVMGVSTDTVDSHKKFVEKERLNFSLLADTDKKMTTDYGVLGPSGYANRVTFVINGAGIIQEIDRAVNGQFNRTGTTLTTRHGTNLALLLTNWKAAVGQPVPNFSVAGIDGRTISLQPAGKKASVVFFLSAKSGASIAYRDRIRELALDPAYKEVAFLGLYSNRDESIAAVKSESELQKFGFPITRDDGNKLADHFGATVTPAAWVINSTGIAVYSGAIDDNSDPARATTHYLKDAIDAALAAKPVAIPRRRRMVRRSRRCR